MNAKISHDRNDESKEAKVKWFQSLSLAERMDLLCEFTDLALAITPGIADKKNVKPIKGRIRILSES